MLAVCVFVFCCSQAESIKNDKMSTIEFLIFVIENCIKTPLSDLCNFINYNIKLMQFKCWNLFSRLIS
ncbi:hypothetical protein bthur0001_42630 [Bacillus thuringiensis serovar tochigiensis BGSC 4Y1]|nr:hypothetical protein bthur0001_42630 [Bacillus thuringiensis serovar tochigiensis BGSC 4Y1]